MTKNELNLIIDLWKRDWLNEKGQQAFHNECVRVCKCFAKVDRAYDTTIDYAAPEFDLIPEISTIKVTLHKYRNCDYLRFIPAKSLLFNNEQLTHKGLGREICLALLDEGNKTGMKWLNERKTK